MRVGWQELPLPANSEFPVETIHPTAGIDQFLFSCEKRVTFGADFHADILFRGLGLKCFTTCAPHVGGLVDWMDALFHNHNTFLYASEKPTFLAIILIEAKPKIIIPYLLRERKGSAWVFSAFEHTVWYLGDLWASLSILRPSFRR